LHHDGRDFDDLVGFRRSFEGFVLRVVVSFEVDLIEADDGNLTHCLRGSDALPLSTRQ
jgi:hypothetical protein